MARPTQFQKLSLQLDAENKKLKAKLQNTKKSLGGIGSAAQKMGAMIAGAFAIREVVRFGKEISSMAAQFEGVSAAFTKLGGEQVIGRLREATKGTVADLELMKRAVQAKNFDIPLKDLAKLFEFATKRAQQTGESVDFLTNSIVLGIGRKSPLILDNLGISAIRLRKELKGVGSEASSVADVAEAVGRIAQEEMEKAGNIIETTAIKTAQWDATWANMSVTLGAFINEGLNKIAPAIDAAIPVVEKLMKKLFGEKGSVEIESQLESFATLTSKERAVELKNMGSRVDELKKEISGLNVIIKQGEDKAWWENKQKSGAAIRNVKGLEDELFILEGTVKRIADKKKVVIDPPKIKPPPKDTFDAAKFFVKETSDDLDKEWANMLDSFEIFPQSWLGDQAAKLSESLNPVLDTVMEETVTWADIMKEKQAEVNSGWVSMAQIIGSVANGIANARDNWAAMGATVLSGVGQMVPQIKKVIAASKALFVAKQAEAVAGSVAASQSVPFPGNLVAMATSIGAVLASIAPFVGSFARGTNFIPRDGLAMVHQGEKILNRGEATRGNKIVLAGNWTIDGRMIRFILDEDDRITGNTF